MATTQTSATTTPLGTTGKADPFGADPFKPVTLSIPLPKVGQALSLHPSYFSLCQLWTFLRWSYKGGHRYKEQLDASGDPVFVPHEREQAGKKLTEPGLTRRKRLSVFKNYCRTIVDRFNDFVFREAGIVRDTTTTGGWIEWREDVDRLGTPIAPFMKQQVQHAQVLGRHFIVMRTSRTPELSAELTAAQATAAGIRVWVEPVFPVDVVDWRRKRGVIREALVRYDDGTAVLYRESDFIAVTLNDAGTIKEVSAPTPHGFGRIPVIEVAPFDETKSQIDDIAELNKQLLNLDSLLRSELYANHFTLFVARGVDKKQLSNAELGTFNILCMPDPNSNLDAMGSDTSQAAGIRDAISDDVREIYKLAGLVAADSDSAGQVESGIARAWKFHEVESKLGAIADESQRVETLIGTLWASGVGTSDAPDPPRYPDTFDVPDLTEEVDRSLALLSSPQIVPSVKVREMTQLGDKLFSDLTTKERALIASEAEELYTRQTDPEIMAAQSDILDQQDT